MQMPLSMAHGDKENDYGSWIQDQNNLSRFPALAANRFLFFTVHVQTGRNIGKTTSCRINFL